MRSVSRGVVDRLLPEARGRQGRRSRSSTRRASRSDVHRGTARSRRRPAAARRRSRRGGGRRRARGGPPARVTSQAGHEPLHLGHALSERARFPGLILWAGEHARPVGAARTLPGEADRGGVTKTQDFEIAATPPSQRHRCRSVEQFTLAQTDQRQGDRGERRGDPHPRAQEADRRARGRSDDPAIKAAGAALTDKLTEVEGEIYQHRNRSSQDPLNYPDQAEQQARGAAGRRRKRRRQADRSVVRGVQGAVGPARQGAGAARGAGQERPRAAFNKAADRLKLSPSNERVKGQGETSSPILP